MTQEILDAIQQGVIIPAIFVIGTFVTILIKAGTDYILEKIKDIRIQKYVRMASESVIVAVNSTNQQFVDALKQGGEFSEECYKEAFEKTKEVAKQLISDEAEKIIGEAYKDFDAWLENLIYAQVRMNKLITPTSTPSTEE